MGEIGKFRVTEMPVRDMIFKEVLEINAHAHTVDTKHSFFPSPWDWVPSQ